VIAVLPSRLTAEENEPGVNKFLLRFGEAVFQSSYHGSRAKKNQSGAKFFLQRFASPTLHRAGKGVAKKANQV
jgi:hypothetical protein